jgi:hypothetical protein
MRGAASRLTLCGHVILAALLAGCGPGGSTTEQGSGGSHGPGSGGDASASGGTTQTGGAIGSGGAPAEGGATGSGGAIGTGGAGGPGSGGAIGTGGRASSGGASGGSSAGGGTPGAGGRAGTTGSGGAPASGGTVGSGGSSASGGTAGSGATGPCDIYQAANTPCGAAHSTVRALYAAYTGPLYQVQRASDKTTKDIPVGAGGFADASVQDSFCSGTTCTIPIVYDQSSNGNHLRVTWFAYWLQSGGNPASATAAKITVGGHPVYGIKSGTNVAYRTGVALSGTAAVNKGSSTVTFSSPQTLPAGTPLLFAANSKDCAPNSWPNNCNFRVYTTAAATSAATSATLTTSYAGTSSSSTVVWNQGTKGIATGDQAESIYSVLDGKTYGQWCCFDYGNSELSGIDDGNATMEAIYFGADTQFGQSGGGSGPWVAADLENGMYEGYENASSKVASNTSVTGFAYVTAMLKGLSVKDCPAGLTTSGCFALKAGNATSGKLAFKFNADTMNYGARPPGYSPQKKEGAIILATGGDGSNTGTGIWFEGAMTMGAPSDATDDAVQANIVAAGYGH